jgi:hypothetical protein
MQSSDGSSRSRRSLLINGRRVRILDLLRSGLLDLGQELLLERPRIGEVHRAVVTSGGRIKLEDGQKFTSPSGAAGAVCGGVAMDGWNAWRVGENGPFLFALRQQLLKSVVDEAETPEAVPHDIEDLVAARRRLDELTAARERAEAGAPEELTVRDLIKGRCPESRGTSVTIRANSMPRHRQFRRVRRCRGGRVGTARRRVGASACSP